MKFTTTEEALTYIKENDLTETMLMIAYNNDRGYSHCIFDTFGVTKHDDSYFAVVDFGENNGGISELRLDINEEEYQKLRTTKKVNIILVQHGDAVDAEWNLIIPTQDDDMRASERDDAINDELLRDMIAFFGIRTSGSIKNLQRDAEMHLAGWLQGQALMKRYGKG